MLQSKNSYIQAGHDLRFENPDYAFHDCKIKVMVKRTKVMPSFQD